MLCYAVQCDAMVHADVRTRNALKKIRCHAEGTRNRTVILKRQRQCQRPVSMPLKYILLVSKHLFSFKALVCGSEGVSELESVPPFLYPCL